MCMCVCVFLAYVGVVCFTRLEVAATGATLVSNDHVPSIRWRRVVPMLIQYSHTAIDDMDGCGVVKVCVCVCVELTNHTHILLFDCGVDVFVKVCRVLFRDRCVSNS